MALASPNHKAGAGSVVWSTIVAVDTSCYEGTAPSSLADVFDTKKLPG